MTRHPSAGLLYQVLWGHKGFTPSVYKVAASPEEAQGIADLLISLWANPGDVVVILECKVLETREVFRKVKGSPKAPNGPPNPPGYPQPHSPLHRRDAP